MENTYTKDYEILKVIKFVKVTKFLKVMKYRWSFNYFSLYLKVKNISVETGF